MSGRSAVAKRKAAASAAAAAAAPASAKSRSEPRSKRSRGAGGGALSEDALADGAGMTALERRQLQRAANESFWSMYDTALLVAWMQDLPEYALHPLSAADLADREIVIDHLSKHAWAIRPKEGVELDELVKCWMTRVPAAQRPPGPMPGLWLHSASSAAAAPASAAAPAQRAQPPVRTKVPKARSLTAAEALAIQTPKPRAKAQDFMVLDEDDEDRGDEEEEPQRYVRANSPDPMPPPPALKGPVSMVGCRFCLKLTSANPESQRTKMFACENCFRRNDLPINDPTNIALVEDGRAALQASWAAKNAQFAPAAAASSASGQSSDSTASLVLSRDRLLEKEFAVLLESHPANPLFGKSAPVDFQSALEKNRKALGATAFARPSAKLLQLIREGKLTSVGYAIPNPIGSGAGSAGKVTLENGSLAVSGAKGAPEVSSPQLFMQAMFATILPALLNDPQGMLQWITLGRTFLAVFERWGGKAASSYLEQYLNERVHGQQDFCEVSTSILTNIEQYSKGGSSTGRGADGPRASQQSAGGGGRDRTPRAAAGSASGGQTCHDYNNNKCSRSQCPFAHKCNQCGGAHPRTSCTRAAGGSQGSKPKPSSSVVSSAKSMAKADGANGNDSE